MSLTYRNKHSSTAIKCVLFVASCLIWVRICALQDGQVILAESGPSCGSRKKNNLKFVTIVYADHYYYFTVL